MSWKPQVLTAVSWEGLRGMVSGRLVLVKDKGGGGVW